MANDELKPDAGEQTSPRERLASLLQKSQFLVYTTLVVFLFMVGFLWPRMFVSVPAGSSGVMYRAFAGGTVKDRIWGEGVHVLPPWDSLTVYDTRVQQKILKLNTLSDEGLEIGVEISIRYRPNKDMLGFLHQDIGTDYFERLVDPEVRSHVRLTFGSRAAYELYASTRETVQELGKVSLLGRAEAGGATRPYVEILELKLLNVALPALVTGSVVEKFKQQQLMLEYRYKLEREEQESERKRTEAAGIRDYSLIASKVSPDLLRWRSIEATLELAKSPNSKVVVLGGAQGAQMLLNVDGVMGPAAAQQPPVDKGDKGQPVEKAQPLPAPLPPPAPAPAIPARP